MRALLRDGLEQAKGFRRLFSYTRPYRGRLMLSWLATAGYAASGALLVSTVKPIFDEVLIKNVRVGEISALILFLYLVKGCSSYFSTTLVADVGQRAITDLRTALYEHVLNQSFTFLSRNTTGALMSHITTDVEKIQNAVSEMAGDLLKEGLTVLGLLIVLFYMDWRLALLSLVGMPLAFHPLIRLGQRLRASNETSLRRWRDISEILQETISGFRVVKAFAMEGFEIARFRRAAARLLRREHADHEDDRDPAPAHGSGGGLRPRGRALLRKPVDPQRAPHHRRPSWPS